MPDDAVRADSAFVTTPDPERSGTDLTAEQSNLARIVKEVTETINLWLKARPELAGELQRLNDAENLGRGSAEEVKKTLEAVEEVRSKVDSIINPKQFKPGDGIYHLANETPLVMSMREHLPGIPDDQIALKTAIDDTILTLELIRPKTYRPPMEYLLRPKAEVHGRYIGYHRKIVQIARLGLSASPAYPPIATRELASLREEIVAREGGRVKNSYMVELGLWALSLTAGGVGAHYLVTLLPFPESVRYLPIAWMGCMFGTWLSFGARRAFITFNDLGRLEGDMLYPAVRLTFTGILTLVLGLIFITGLINVDIAGFKTAAVVSDPLIALVIGIFCGLSEQALPSAVSQRASQFFSELEKKR